MAEQAWDSDRVKDVPFSSIRVVFEEAQRLEAAGRKVFHMEIGRPDFDTPAHIKEAAVKSLAEGNVHYVASLGIPELRQAIADKLQRENSVVVDPNGGVLVTAGVKTVIYCSMQGLLNPGDEVLLPDPCWLDYFGCVRLAGGVPVAVPLREENGFQIDPAEVERLITPRTKILVIITPHNPTGAAASKETLEALAGIAQRRNLLVISDEIYEKQIFDGAVHYSIGSFPGMAERTITVNGFSKAYAMDGWRLGYAAAPNNLIRPILKVHMSSVSCATSFAQAGAVAAYRGSQECVAQMVAEFDRRRRMILDAMGTMEGVQCPRPQGAFYVFPNIKSFGMPSLEMAGYLMKEAAVATVPGSAFGDWGEGYLRLAYADSYENLEQAMQAIKGALDKLRA
ncbi:MAG: pyridoxal phosphate-dependent aminotransferase [Dehalococcoidales bacterium]|nr:pyridoxal phosphate-dependent aminotransferase [Dehalococcoidales bacterium]